MKIKLKSKPIRDGLAIVQRVTGADHAVLQVEDQNIYVSATGNAKTIKWLVEGDVIEPPKKDPGFGFNIYTMTSLCSGRDDIEVEVVKNTVQFHSKTKNSKLKGDFQPLPFEDIKVLHEKTEPVKLGATLMASLLKAIKLVSIQNQFGTEALNLFVKINKDGLFCTVYDVHHLAFTHDPTVNSKQEIQFAIPLPLFDQLSGIVGENDYDLIIGNSTVSAISLGFELNIPTMQGMDKQSFEQAQGLISNLPTTKEYITLPVSDLTQSIENLSGISDGSASVIIGESKGKIKLSLKSSYGSASEILKHEAHLKEEHSISPILLSDILRVYPEEEIKLQFTNNQMIVDLEQRKSKVYYVCVLK